MGGLNKKVGVVIVSKFLTSSSKKFNSYIDYIGREEAIRNEKFNRYSLYEDYMGNPSKTTGLFNADSDLMNEDEKINAQKLFRKAQKNNSIMWQDVFSFDNDWLKEQGLYNPITKELDEVKIKDAVRKSIDYSLGKKDILESSVWNGAIHYNTDNIHIHVAICEPEPTVQRGKRTQKTLDEMKSKFVNELLNSNENYKDINNIIRSEIIGENNNSLVLKDKKLKSLMKDVIKNLPDDKRHWHYGYNTMNDSKKYLDEMTKYYIDTYKKNEFNELLTKLNKQELILKETYGVGNRAKYKDYKQSKIDDLYKRMGNAFLSEIKDYIKSEEETQKQHNLNKRNTYKFHGKIMSKRDLNKIKKALGNEFDSVKNLNYYQQLQQKIDNDISI